ncbi:hypothetical protein K4A76_16920 [Pseudomonas sp. NEEL19]|uniref:hypothetical protein n=1 Tax=Pseudomonas sp. NEEL19 TaxID=2867409 RepID=UPI002368D9A5|nr:hypothetical protein [Pseudomonas sp. NEEL19]WDM58131.1 hypothetical protein K4A76_16920 [Pseudomonas sp. NEEL19]
MASKRELIDWMAMDSRLLKWGMIAAFDRATLNRFLLQEYIRRFSDESYFPPICGMVSSASNDWQYRFESFVLDTPRVSFETAALDNSKADMTLRVIGGNLLSKKKINGQWQVREIEWIDPLQGPVLKLHLKLSDVPGLVSDGGELLLDLKHSSDFTLTFTDEPYENSLGGLVFKELFESLPDAQRRFLLGRIQRGEHELMHPQSFIMRTQSAGEGSEGGVLGLVRMENARYNGDEPTPGSDFRYLVADDHTATVMMDTRYFSIPALGHELPKVISGGTFKTNYDHIGFPSGLEVSGGVLALADTPYPVSMPIPEELGYEDRYVKIWYAIENLDVSAEGLKFEARDGRVYCSWPVKQDFNVLIMGFENPWYLFMYTLALGYAAVYRPDLIERLASLVPVHVDTTVTGYYEGQKDSANLVYTSTSTVSDGRSQRLKGSRRVRTLEPPTNEELDRFCDFLLMVHDTIAGLIMKDGLILYEIAKSIENDALNLLPIKISMEEPIRSVLTMNFGEVVRVSDIVAPYDAVAFGDISPARTQVQLNTYEHILAAGESYQFSTASPFVVWSVEAIHGMGKAGSIDSHGLYTAPPAELIEGAFTRVRVTATAVGSKATALLTIMRNVLQLNPQVKATSNTEEVELLASTLTTGGKLSWSVTEHAMAGSLEPAADGLSATYRAYEPKDGERMPSYVLDEITVSDTLGNSKVCHQIAMHREPLLEVQMVAMNEGSVQLESRFDGDPITGGLWEVIAGPGEVDASGLYTVDETLPASRYAVVGCSVDGGPFGIFDGFIILPLPLTEQQRALPGSVEVVAGQGVRQVHSL